MIKTEDDYKNACKKLEELSDAPNFGETKESIIEFEKLSDSKKQTNSCWIKI